MEMENNKSYLKFNINTKDHKFSMDTIKGKKPSSAMDELKNIETIVEKNIQKNDSIFELKSDVNTLINLKGYIQTIAEGFQDKANTKLNSIKGKFFAFISERIIKKRNTAVQRQMEKLTKEINKKLEELQPKSEIDSDDSGNLISLTKNFMKESEELKNKFYKKSGDNKQNIKQLGNKSNNLMNLSKDYKQNAKNLNERMNKSSSEEGFLSSIFGGKKKEKTNIIKEKQEINEKNRINENKQMFTAVNKTPISFVNHLKNAFLSDFKEGSDINKFNTFIEDLSQLFPSSALEHHIKQYSQGLKSERNSDPLTKFIGDIKKKDNSTEVIRNSAEDFAEKIIEQKNHLISYMNDPKKTKLGLLEKQIISNEWQPLINLMLKHKSGFESISNQIEDDSKFKQVLDKLSNAMELLKDKNIKKEALQEQLTQVIMDVIVLSLEAINESNGRK